MFQWIDSRTGACTGLKKLYDWTVPPTCPGGYLPCAVFFLFLVQVITGIVLWLYYSTGSQTAWESIFYVQFSVPGGWLLRGIHHYSAQMMVFLLGVYLVAVLLSGRYREPREFLFWATLLLFFCVLGSCLTGDLLTWSNSGYSSTKVRMNFLYLLPEPVGAWLFKLAAGGQGPDLGTMTITRFLVLHILVCGGGFFGLAVLWSLFDIRSSKLDYDTSHKGIPNTTQGSGTPQSCTRSPCACSRSSRPLPSRVSFWGFEMFKCASVCFLAMLAVLFLVYHKPLLKWENRQLPPQASLGAEMFAPADPANPYDAARPEWSFRALYQLSNLETHHVFLEKPTIAEDGSKRSSQLFPGERKFVPIFLITGCITYYFFLVPFIGMVRLGPFRAGHYLNVVVTLSLVVIVCYFSYLSYKHDRDTPGYLADVAAAEHLYERCVELALGDYVVPAPDNWDWKTKLSPPAVPQVSITEGGMLEMIRRDPKIQGPVLFATYCASCHPFVPMEGQVAVADFPPIPCSGSPSAPNLYQSTTAQWMAGFLDAKRITSEEYFGNTAFKNGSMAADYVKGTLRDILKDEEDGKEWVKTVIDVLVSESKLDSLRPVAADGTVAGLTDEQLELFGGDYLSCTDCHPFYSATKPKKLTVDLRGYMSQEWIAGIIANPTSIRFYGDSNDRMPVYYHNDTDHTLTKEEIQLLADWLHGKWFHPSLRHR